jgi:AraC-like DNA-binding protein/transcriptional regulator with XRE-family HTH domain
MTITTSGKRKALGELLAQVRRDQSLDPEEVAERAGVGRTWYEWLEAGRDIGLSATSLRWVADALAISGARLATLFQLAGVKEDAEVAGSVEPVAPEVARAIDAMAPHPAYLIGRRGHVLVWNQPTEAVYRCHLIPPLCRNVYMFLFAQPDVRKLIVNWEHQAHRLVGDFKASLAADPHDRVLLDLRRRLDALNPDFRRIYRSRPQADTRQTIFSHPRVGPMTFDLQDLAVADQPGQKIRVYQPRHDDGTHVRLSKLIQLHTRDESNQEHRGLLVAIRRAKEHLDASYAGGVPLEELTALLQVDKYRLIRAFAREVGYPPYAYQLLVRIFHARRLLTEGRAAADVAAMVGFADQSHLIRHFRRIEGVTPAQHVAAATRAAPQ